MASFYKRKNSRIDAFAANCSTILNKAEQNFRLPDLTLIETLLGLIIINS
jgi:hypothetical protein